MHEASTLITLLQPYCCFFNLSNTLIITYSILKVKYNEFITFRELMVYEVTEK